MYHGKRRVIEAMQSPKQTPLHTPRYPSLHPTSQLTPLLERTFLAWLRTSLSFASIGIAITQLFRLNSSLPSSSPNPSSPSSSSFSTNADAASADAASFHHLRHVGKPLGATFIAVSIVTLLIGFHRYFEAQHYVIRGKFPASRGSVVVVTGTAGALIVACLVVVLAVGAGR